MSKVDEKIAYQLLFDHFYETLSLFAERIVKDSEAAKDIVQECFIDFWYNKRLFTVKEKLDHYLFRAVKYKSLNYIRDKHVRKNNHELAGKEIPLTEENVEDPDIERMEILYTAINALPTERRKIFLMICVDEMKYQEVADRLGLSRNTVKTQMSRSLKYIRETLEKHKYIFFPKKWADVSP